VLHERIRTEPPGRYLVTAAYHTPNGHLHLGHLAGPFLSGDVLARWLGVLGHDVRRITATDALEPYVLLSAIALGRDPREVAATYYASARDTLRGFDLHQDAFLDLSAEPWATEYRRRSRDLAAHFARRGRLHTRELRLGRSARSGRYLVGPFALGRCPGCGSEAAGTSCEACGLWFTPDKLRGVTPRLAADADPEWQSVPTRFLAAAPEFGVEEVRRRFPAEFTGLLGDFLAHNGPWLHVSQPLGWGVRWDDPALPAESVHVSYGLGSTVAADLISQAYQEITGHGSPFARSGSATTVLTAGYDAALPCMFLLATMDDELDRRPFDHHVLNSFVRLNGAKFSTSRGHVITGPDYLSAGLPTDPFRLYGARLRTGDTEPNFRPADFAEYATTHWHDRLGALLARARDTAPDELDANTRDAVADALRRMARALALPNPDLRAGALVVEDWLAAGESGLAASAPFWWLKALALLAQPYLPRWTESAWQGLGGHGTPTLTGFETPTPTTVRWPEPLPPVSAARLDDLLPTPAETERLAL
jgi:methionyl-tRNA synthetase